MKVNGNSGTTHNGYIAGYKENRTDKTPESGCECTTTNYTNNAKRTDKGPTVVKTAR
jgi:hypothetical protein